MGVGIINVKETNMFYREIILYNIFKLSVLLNSYLNKALHMY